MAVDDIIVIKSQASEDMMDCLGVSATYIPINHLIPSFSIVVKVSSVESQVPDGVEGYVMTMYKTAKFRKSDLPAGYTPTRGDRLIIPSESPYVIDNLAAGSRELLKYAIVPLHTTTSSSSSTSTTSSSTSTTSTTSSTYSTASTTTSSSSTTSTMSSTSSFSTTSTSSSTTSSTASSSSSTSTTSTVSTTASSSSSTSTTSTVSTTSSTVSTTSSTYSSTSTTSTVSTTSSTTSSSSSSTTSSTYWCEYNDRFDDIDAWFVTKKHGTETFTLDAGTGKLDVPDGIDGNVMTSYQYLLGSGDAIVDIDLADYAKDASIGPVITIDIDSTLSGVGSTYIRIRCYDNAGTWRIRNYYRINGVNTDISYVNIAGQPAKFRFVRSGNTISTYYYISSWVLIGSKDYGVYAADISVFEATLADFSLHGGYAKFDNLVFRDGCPAGYPKAWTTSSTSTSSSTSSTSSTTSSTASTVSTTSSTSSTASTLSTTKSSTSTTTSSTTSSTLSSTTSSTSSTVSTLSTTTTTTLSTTTTTTTPPP